MARLNYVELPVRDIGAAKSFYESVFGWSLTDFGPTYAATLTGDTDIGLQADVSEATRAPLPVIEVDDLEAAFEAVSRAGGRDREADLRFPRRPPLSVPRSQRQRDGLPQVGLSRRRRSPGAPDPWLAEASAADGTAARRRASSSAKALRIQFRMQVDFVRQLPRPCLVAACTPTAASLARARGPGPSGGARALRCRTARMLLSGRKPSRHFASAAAFMSPTRRP